MNRDPNLSCYLIEQDDDGPPPRTIPEKPVTGHRYMQALLYGLWDVYDWEAAECRSCLGTGRINEDDGTHRKCLDCTGTGSSHQEPDRIACDLTEADARLLVYGAALLEMLTLATTILEGVNERCTQDTAFIVRVRAVLANVRGGAG